MNEKAYKAMSNRSRSGKYRSRDRYPGCRHCGRCDRDRQRGKAPERETGAHFLSGFSDRKEAVFLNLKTRKRIRALGKILFVLYVFFIIYFLIFSDWYGRTGVYTDYHYNLVLFKEIKRFWEYRDQVGFFAMFTNLFGNVDHLYSLWIFLTDGKQAQKPVCHGIL